MGSLMEYRRRILLNTPHLESASGSVAHFTTDMAAKLKECRVNFLPQQAGSGDPSPSNVRAISGWTGCDVVRSGKNIVEVIGYSATNVSSKTATRKLTNYYGTTLSTTDFSLPDTSVTITQSQWPKDTYHYENGYMCVVVDNIMFEKRYNVSFRITNITNNPLNVDISAIRLISLNSGSYRSVVIGDRLCFNNVLFSQMTSYPDKSEFEIRICGMSFTLSEFMVTPVEDEDYTYAPYDPDKITVSFPCVGKNLATIQGLLDEAERAYTSVTEDNRSCVCVRGSGNTGQALKGQFKENTRYTISLDSKCIKRLDSQSDPTSPFRINFAYTDGTTSIGISVSLSNNPNWDHFSATSSSGKTIDYIWFGNYETRLDTYIDVNTFMLEEGSTATPYEPYNNTLYGGYIDLIRGELVVEWEKITTDSGRFWMQNSARLGIEISPAKYDITNTAICTMLPKDKNWTYGFRENGTTKNDIRLIYTGDGNGWSDLDPSIVDAESGKSYLDSIGFAMVAKLLTPITYPLSPEIIKTLKGANNVWSDVNGDVSVKFWTH